MADECNFGFDPDYGTATFVTTPVYAGGTDLFLTTDYEKNGSDAAGCYLVYNVERADGTNVGDGAISPAVIEDPAGSRNPHNEQSVARSIRFLYNNCRC